MTSCLLACESAPTDSPENQVNAPQQEEISPVELNAEFLGRGMAALEGDLATAQGVLEVRATGLRLSVQFAPKDAAKTLSQVDYVETSELGKPPLGQKHGPFVVQLRGQGKLEENLFSLADVDLQKMARAFSTARLAVDPEDGTVERLVVRRFLPFSKAIRGRIFVHSPRLSGSIDTNDQGVPLRR